MYKKRKLLMAAMAAVLSLSGCDRSGITIEGGTVNGAQILSEEIAEGSDETETAVEEPADCKTEAEKEAAKELTVHVCGAVKLPGVYILAEDARLYEAVALAGGFREEAAEEYLNLALPLEDGMQIVVPTTEEVEALAKAEGESRPAGIRQGSGESLLQEPKADGRVNINMAGKAELMTLPGIGESRAEAIISYREQNGDFRTEEELMKVSGIKEASYRKLEEYIAVSG